MKSKSTTSLTAAQRKGVEFVHSDVCVTAGAGSGKTRVLVERFVHLVVNEKTPIQNVLTITFTEKAANEMKERIAEWFEQEGLVEEFQQVESAYISTIDSFSARLLREYALEADVDPEFTVLDEYESRYLLCNLAETLLSEWGASNRRDFDILLKGLHCQGLGEAAVNIIGKARSTGTAMRDIIEIDVGPGEMKAVLGNISACLDKLKGHIEGNTVSEKTLEKIRAITSKLFPIIGLGGNARGELTVDHINSIDEVLKVHGGLQVSKAVKSDLRELRDELLPELRRLFFERKSVGVKRTLKKFLAELVEKYGEEKRSRSALDFSDLAEKAIQLLRTAPHVRSELRDKFKHILVDEFQDTNKLQKSLIDLLRSHGNLFVVGDARQSIYGFRDADLDVFLQHREEVAGKGGAVIRLDENFRTRPEVIDFINYVFEDVPEGDGRVEHSELIAASHFKKKRGPSVELIMARGETMDVARPLEAAALARRIHDIVEKEEIKITRLNGTDVDTPVSYGDIAILMRATADIKLYERALAELNIPFFVVRGRGLYNTREITDLVNLLKVIDNPLDEIRLAAVLRSPFVGVSDECLFWLAHYGKDKNGDGKEMFYTLSHADEIPEIEPRHRDRLLRFAEHMRVFRDLKGRLSLGALMDAVIDRTDFDTRMLALPSGMQKYANIRKVVELARGLEKKGFSGLNEFFRVVSDLRVMETRESEAPIDVEKSDVVKLMTIHSAKGLEFPVVALADLSRGRRSRTGDLTFSKGVGLGFKTLNPVTGRPETTRSHYRIAEEQEQKDLQEMGRVFYVALTRAEEHLLLSGALCPRDRGGWLKYLVENLGLSMEVEDDIPKSITYGSNGCRLRIITEVGQHKTRRSFKKLPALDRQKLLGGKKLELPPEAPGPVKDAVSLLRAAPEPGGGAGNYVYSTTEIMSFLLCPRLYYLRYNLGVPAIHAAPREEDAGHLREQDEIRRDVLGDVAHMVLERCGVACKETELRESVLQAFNRALIAKPKQAQVDLVTKWVEDFYSSSLGRMVRDSEMVERELPFVFNHKGNPIRGKIDLLFSPDGSGLHLVDYKSSAVIPKEVKGYEFQMRLYSLAVEAIYGRRPREALLFFIAAKEAVPVDISPGAIKRLEDELETFFRARGRDVLAEIKGPHCEWCEYHAYCDAE
ncbi:MAG: UvrD-helicase domain-containing protein [Candidatus Brocadiales bacterium]|nr:UvrD-helicase domain-containing protein [Candidatus Bathyanammoxibius amoris]